MFGLALAIVAIAAMYRAYCVVRDECARSPSSEPDAGDDTDPRAPAQPATTRRSRSPAFGPASPFAASWSSTFDARCELPVSAATAAGPTRASDASRSDAGEAASRAAVSSSRPL